MTTIPLSNATIGAYMGGHKTFNHCKEISMIHVEYHLAGDDDDDEDDEGDELTVTPHFFAHVEARIPASTTGQGYYEINAQVAMDGTRILGTSCSCPVGHKCKHVYKVLHRIAAGPAIGSPSPRVLQERARRHQQQQAAAARMEHASVYVAIACKSELDHHSSYNRRWDCEVKENFDQTILGIFFSLTTANRCAKAYCISDLGLDDWDDDDEDDDDDMDDDDDDDDELFSYDASEKGDYTEDSSYDKVWVERRAIEDASRNFHR